MIMSYVTVWVQTTGSAKECLLRKRQWNVKETTKPANFVYKINNSILYQLFRFTFSIPFPLFVVQLERVYQFVFLPFSTAREGLLFALKAHYAEEPSQDA